MGKTYDGIGEGHRELIESQPLFFVATAPLAADGHVNVSPRAWTPSGSSRTIG